MLRFIQLAVLVLPTAVLASPTAQEFDSQHRGEVLWYLFSKADALHVEQVELLLELAPALIPSYRLHGVDLELNSQAEGSDATADHSRALLVDRRGYSVGLETQVPQPVFEALIVPRGRFMMFVEGMNRPATVKGVVGMRGVLETISNRFLPTDIQEDTWGKIKVFFN